ncbi:MAG: DegT/DnrJ/EryC1/StrS family aminotransferase [Gemmatimonadaceae bacterium]|nr:DegT/DnrJ/EryC1/StrS family aminotransferase [Gemmatimonadaceae bacterium]
MIGRRQLPVASPVRASALVRAAWPAFWRSARGRRALAAELRERYGARGALLTDSGTSALVLALRLAVGGGEGKTVAFPGYACVDLAAAARFARVRVRLYDLDPRTLAPDLDSLVAAIARGVDAIVIAHLYGFPAYTPALAALAARHGIPIIEDAAQGAGGLIDGTPLGALGALSVLSFGRGKGTTGGHGGALLWREPRFDQPATHAAQPLSRPRRGWGDLAAATAQWALGRPALYGIPSAIPALRLGEMVYHPAHEPRPLSAAAASLVRRALVAADREVVIRRRNAAALEIAAEEGSDIQTIHPVAGGESGYLRYPVVDGGVRDERPDLGVLRGYPRTLHEQAELRPVLHPGEPPTPGATELRQGLFTVPTHSMVTRQDMEKLIDWLRVPTRLLVPVHADGKRGVRHPRIAFRRAHSK